MSTLKETKKQMIEIGKLKLPTRITVKRIKRVKELTGIDLTSQDTESVVAFIRDPITVVEVCAALYSDHLSSAGLSTDDFDDLCGPEEITALRQEVTDQMKSFSPFWAIICTNLEALLAGDTSLLEIVKASQGAPTGPSS